MTRQAELLSKIEKLPPQYFGEVIDFVEYLQKKTQNDNADETKAMPADTEHGWEAREWRNPLLGLAEEKGATLTLNRFMEMQQEEIERENRNDQSNHYH